MRYSLSNYILTIKCNDESMNTVFGAISIGGEGSYLNSITINVTQSLFSTNSYATGGWVHDKNLSKVGTISVSLNQMTSQIAKFKQLCKFYYSGDYDGMTFVLSDADGNEVATCNDCFPVKIASQEFSQKANDQMWEFTAGKIVFN